MTNEKFIELLRKARNEISALDGKLARALGAASDHKHQLLDEIDDALRAAKPRARQCSHARPIEVSQEMIDRGTSKVPEPGRYCMNCGVRLPGSTGESR